LKLALIPIGIDLDKEKNEAKKKSLKGRGPMPDTAGLAKLGVDYDSI